MRNGGRRPGAGRPKGSKSTKTLEKEAARELVRQVGTEQMGSLLTAHIDNAMAEPATIGLVGMPLLAAWIVCRRRLPRK